MLGSPGGSSGSSGSSTTTSTSGSSSTITSTSTWTLPALPGVTKLTLTDIQACMAKFLERSYFSTFPRTYFDCVSASQSIIQEELKDSGFGFVGCKDVKNITSPYFSHVTAAARSSSQMVILADVGLYLPAPLSISEPSSSSDLTTCSTEEYKTGIEWSQSDCILMKRFNVKYKSNKQSYYYVKEKGEVALTSSEEWVFRLYDAQGRLLVYIKYWGDLKEQKKKNYLQMKLHPSISKQPPYKYPTKAKLRRDLQFDLQDFTWIDSRILITALASKLIKDVEHLLA